MSSMSPISQEIVSLMRARRTPQTDEALQQAFGISYNTWRRINAGQAIRASVAERLICARRHPDGGDPTWRGMVSTMRMSGRVRRQGTWTDGGKIESRCG